MRPKVTQAAKRILVTEGGKKLGIKTKKGVSYIPFDTIELKRVNRYEFVITLYHKDIPILEWTDMPPIGIGDTICIHDLTRCSMEFTLT